MGLSVQKYGQWSEAGIALKNLTAKLNPTFQAQLTSDGNLVLQKLRGHIDAQDLSWKPLSARTIQLKNGNDTIYVETGFLRDNLEVRKIKSSTYGITLFVGASAWKTTREGVKLSDLMIWLEYGTNRIPARPLIRPTWEEVKSILQDNWKKCLGDLIANRR